MVFQCINIRQVPWEVLKTAASGLGFQHLPRDLANVNVWKTMFDPYMHIRQISLQPCASLHFDEAFFLSVYRTIPYDKVSLGSDRHGLLLAIRI